LDLGHSLDLEHKTLVTELGRYVKRYLDLGGTSWGLLSKNGFFWKVFAKYWIIWRFLDEITLKTAILVTNICLKAVDRPSALYPGTLLYI